jgi:hypothetical protein
VQSRVTAATESRFRMLRPAQRTVHAVSWVPATHRQNLA